MVNFLIVHYNTPELTGALLKSIDKFVKDYRVYIFENGVRHLKDLPEGTIVYDNSNGQIIDFEKELRKYPNRMKSLGKASRWGSFKHCISVDACFDLIREPFILLDSDVLLKKDPSDIVDGNVYWAGEPVEWSWKKTSSDWPKTIRIRPFVCYINVPKCLDKGIRYFDANHMAGLWNPDKYADSFDTGAWLYEQTKEFENKVISSDEYCVHFRGGSYDRVRNRNTFLHNNRSLYEIQESKYSEIRETANPIVSDVVKTNTYSKKMKVINRVREVHPLTVYSENPNFIKSTNKIGGEIKRISASEKLMEFRKARNYSKYKADSVQTEKMDTHVEYIPKNIVDSAISRARSIIGASALENPKTIQEKLHWINCYDTEDIELKTNCCDKLGLREYCKEILGKDICPPVLKVYSGVNDINFDELPDKFVLKCNHGSGFNIIVNGKNSINRSSTVTKLSGWLSKNYCTSYWYELCYYNVKPTVFAEDCLGNNIFDYKFWCFNGEPELFTINGGNGHGDILYYKLDGTPIDLYGRFDGKDLNTVFTKPAKFTEMVEYAKKLSSKFKFVRVDFYEVDNRVYLGELTFMPGAGNFKYKGKDENLLVGNMLDLKLPSSDPIQQPTAVVGSGKNTRVVYMAIVGNIDKIVPPKVRTAGFDYICYCDDPTKKCDGWEMRPIPDKLKDLPKAKQNRYIKTHPHEFFPEYEFSIYIDGNVDLKGNLDEFISKYKITRDRGSIFLGMHPARKCLYAERDIVVKMKKDTKENTQAMIDKYKSEGFPTNYGLSQNCMLFRFHNEPGCIKIMEQWWDEIEKYSHRDQLSLFYVFWKNQDVKPVMLSKDIFKSNYLYWNAVHRK